MGLLSIFRLATLAHRWALNTSSKAAILHMLLAEVLCSAGAAINVLRIPECWLHTRQPQGGPRRAQPLDLAGNSHQIMHLLTAFAMCHMYWSIADEAAFIDAHPSCPP